MRRRRSTLLLLRGFLFKGALHSLVSSVGTTGGTGADRSPSLPVRVSSALARSSLARWPPLF